MDGKLAGWDGAFVTPVHVGHPEFANRGGQFLYLWDEKNLYIGLRCLDQKPAQVRQRDYVEVREGAAREPGEVAACLIAPVAPRADHVGDHVWPGRSGVVAS